MPSFHLVVVMAMMGAVAIRHWAQGYIDNASGCGKAGLPLQAERLQRERVLRAANEEVGTDTDADRRIGTNATVAPGQGAAANTMARRMNRPGKAGLLGDANVEANAMNGCHISVHATVNATEITAQLCR